VVSFHAEIHHFIMIIIVELFLLFFFLAFICNDKQLNQIEMNCPTWYITDSMELP